MYLIRVVFLLFFSGLFFPALSQTCDNWLNLPSYQSYVSVGDLDVPGNQITVEAVFMRTAPYTGGPVWAGDLVSKHNNPPDVNYLLRPNNAEITTTNGYFITPPICEIELNKVYHAAMVYDGTRLKFYRNGFLMSSVACTGNMFQNNFQTRIGLYDALVHQENLIGYINEVRIWNVARTQAQIRTYMSASLPNPGSQTGLLAYYTFDNLLNKQGNASWNGVLGGSASINATIPDCSFVADSCARLLQPDSIVVNDYTEVLGVDQGCKNEIIVSDASRFNIGDTVIIMQMKGAVADSTNTAAFGTIRDYRNAGQYEYNFVAGKTGNRIELRNIMLRTYDIPDGRVQLIRVPYYQNYSTTKTMTCLPWDGRVGGVLAYNVAGTLTLNHDLDVSGKGFRGGIDPFSNPSPMYCYESQYFYPPNPDLASQKGEGIAELSVAKSFGRGALGNGGGGGNSHNSGGGGGANAATGGMGGYNYDLAPCNTTVPFDNRGIGGRALPYSNTENRVFLGGGGGAGQSNNPDGFQASGGNGGGIILVTANTLVANGHAIKADGYAGFTCNGTNTYCHEGMGGGGGGGAVLLSIQTYTDLATAVARGGKGADMVAVGIGRLGPGGGGSGGVVWTTGTATPSLTATITGGINGTNTGSGNDAWGATAGSIGLQLNDLSLPIATTPFKKNIDSVRIHETKITCPEWTFEGLAYVNVAPVATWNWTFGDGGTATTQNAGHTYTSSGNYDVKLVATDINGCKDSFAVRLNVEVADFDFNYTADVCNTLTYQFSGVGNTQTNPYWDMGDGTIITGNLNPVHTFSSPGNYMIKYTVGSGQCADTVRKVITVDIQWQDLIITPDTTICLGATKQLRTVPVLSFCWKPVDYLDNPLLANPTTSTPGEIVYYFTAEVEGNNLIQNGDFSQGNTGFSSVYNYSPASGLNEGTYTIATSVPAWHSGLSNCSGRGGSGNMMLVNGSGSLGAEVWKQTISVQPNTNYAFSSWLQSLSSASPAQLQFSINGKLVGLELTGSPATCSWAQFYTTWNSGSNTTATISIVNKNLQVLGNDFALDDISFAPVLIRWDSVKISVDTALVKANADTTICEKGQVQLQASGAAAYAWTPATGLSSTTISNPVATPSADTRYIVTGTTIHGCVAKDTVDISIYTKPAIGITPDTSICHNTTAQLYVSGGVSYSWSPHPTLSSTTVSNPVATPTSDTKYFVTITDVNTCSYRDSVTVALRPLPVFTVNAPVRICRTDTIQLQASGGDSYQWSPADNAIDNIYVPNPSVSPGFTTQYQVTITETICNISTTLSTQVTVLPRPVVSATRSNDLDCTLESSQLNATGALRYEWSPAATLTNAGIRNPVATPRATTSYVVKGTDANGCMAADTVVVKVEKVNEGSYLMPNAFTPNGDGLNDCYGIKYWGTIDKLEFSIYNRWGERIFYTTDPRACWDGTYKGIKQNGDVFVYMIRAKTFCSEEVFRKGTFVLIR
ncbi:MAG: gliding motility-associated C-terminal domain-containing protein [Sphingobacteriales bacterium]|nr:gliding motility-associated C-terminal domain-containing protein [Sphingobacteriales bacterium]OJW34872.1 MAG: hypothetical protein BGO54_06175 [Sphingobacteriales bacterium 46-32]